MTASQLPLLIGLLIALAIVLVLIVRQLRGGASLQLPQGPDTTAAPQVAPHATRFPAATSRATSTPTRASAPSTAGSVPVIASWGYQLQNLDLDNAAHSPFDLLVIDTTLDGSDETTLTAAQIERLKRKSDGNRRLVLAYLSIGEAESYRTYWDKQWKRNKPEWLLGENPEWKENYAVCFWHPGWQAIMCGSPEARLDMVMAAGFDGVYLDKCDVYEDLKRRYKSVAGSRPDIEADMVAFIAQLSAYAKARNPAFMVVMQNAEELLERDDLRANLDGVAKEELVYGGYGPEKLNPADDFKSSRGLLDLMRRDSKLVLVVEYLDDQTKANHASELLAPLGFVLYVAPKDRELKRLNYEVLSA